jgi:predicted DNA-binding transcriptional regulator AlpA
MSRKLRKRAVADRYGVTTKTIDRWAADKRLGFPPAIYISETTPLWDEAQLEAFERSRARPSRPQTDLETSY